MIAVSDNVTESTQSIQQSIREDINQSLEDSAYGVGVGFDVLPSDCLAASLA